LRDKRDSLAGKRVLITGSGQVALAVAERVLAFGGVPLTFSDWSGHIYEEVGV
jgi:glutamate dehydrogenase (NADP+)